VITNSKPNGVFVKFVEFKCVKVPKTNGRSDMENSLSTNVADSAEIIDVVPRERGAAIMRLLFNATLYACMYLVLMAPTYVLPWSGSNSYLAILAIGVFTSGIPPQTIAHLWCLAMLVLIAWPRGGLIGRPYLLVFPFLAAFFDFAPGLNTIPLIPTLMHLLAIILGVMTVPNFDLGDVPIAKTGKQVFIAFVVVNVVCFLMLATGLARFANHLKAQPSPVQVQAPKAKKSEANAPEAGAALPANKALQQTSKPSVDKSVALTMISDGESCFAQKKFECAIANANSALKVDPSSSLAKDLLSKSQYAQKKALQSITIN